MSQKVIKIGSSQGVTIPKSTLDRLNIGCGSEIDVVYNKSRQCIEIHPVVNEQEDYKGFKDLELIVKRYRAELEKLDDEHN